MTPPEFMTREFVGGPKDGVRGLVATSTIEVVIHGMSTIQERRPTGGVELRSVSARRGRYRLAGSDMTWVGWDDEA